jgi:hypothetical protein
LDSAENSLAPHCNQADFIEVAAFGTIPGNRI